MKLLGNALVGPDGMFLPFTPAVQSGGLLFLSGQLALRSGVLTGTDIGRQTDVIFDNIEAILEPQGLGLGNLVKCTVWLRRATDFRLFNEVYAHRLREHRPARSTVISDLVLPEALVEIEAVAERA
jgi:2-iminobutanoate/2-iminopropanoate deaminase